ncbi:MAG: family 20 glycosylhydrolase [Anaerolineae bacterium]|nr:family 20 glycosylhydrolase [Anaerolineae bacterium]
MAAKRSPCVIPEPKQVEWRAAQFTLAADTWLVLLPDAPEADLVAARALQREIQEASGLDLPIVKTAQPARSDNIILLVSDQEAAEGYLAGAGFSTSDLAWDRALAAHGEQAYLIDVSPRRVIAGGRGSLALYYAVQTLRQMVRVEGPRWPAMRLRDWPALPYRGLMLDVSRGKVPTLETLKHLVDELSLYKLNVLQLYTEHTFLFPHHPRIGEGCDPLSGDDMLTLDHYARERHVELVPNLQSFGHCAHILSMPEYRHLAELPAAGWSLCPQDEATYRFLEELYGDLLPNFSSDTLNINCDETYDLGAGRSAQAVAERGVGRVYLEHILRLRELARAHGRRIQLWGDILLHHPELVPELPDDVILLDWHYGAADDYPSVRTFAESGRAFWVCPGTSSWNTLFPRIENANVNIRTLARLGTEHGAQGLLNTDWGDYGHYQPLGQCWYGYLYGAEQAWTGGVTEDERFDARFGPLFFGARGDEVVQAMRTIGRLNILEGMPRPNAANSIYALLDEPLVGTMIAELPEATCVEIVRVGAEAQAALRRTLPVVRDRLSVEEMIYSVRMMAYAARKVLASQGIRRDLARLAQGGGSGADMLRQAMETLRSLDAERVHLTELFEELWLRRARRSEIDITLSHLARLGERFAAAVAWLGERLAEVEAGETPDYTLDAYQQAAADYEVLGQSFRRRMQEAGVF